MAQISVIVPVYNSERYLKKCVDSLLVQTCCDIEIVLVNDGSSDGSFDICKQYSNIDTRVKVVNQANKGAGVARMNGAKNASAPYITFIDSDDYVENDFCCALLSAQRKTNADLVECSYNVVSGKSIKKHSFLATDKVLDRKGFENAVIKGTIISGTEAVVLWNKLYKKDLFLSLVTNTFANVLEDYVMNMQYYKGVNKYAYVNKPLVNYVITENSLSRKFNYNLIDDFLSVAQYKIAYLKENGFSSDEDIKNNANWFMRYLENYLILGVRDKVFRQKMASILSNSIVEKQSLKSDTLFSSLIINKNIKKTTRMLVKKSIKRELKRKLFKLKTKIKNIF